MPATSGITAAMQSGNGFREGVTPRMPDASTAQKLKQIPFAGATEALDLATKVSTYGLGWTARNELRREQEYVADADTRTGTMLRAGQSGSQLVGVMLTITLAAAIGFVGTKVTSEIDSSIDTTAGTNYAHAEDNISSGFADAMGLTDIVFLVLMFGVILGALLAFRGRR